MGKYLSLLGGAVAIVAGVVLLLNWWVYFFRALQAAVPVILILGGLVALFAAISEIKDSCGCKKEESKKE